jgi:hypothetical protein
MLLAEEIFQRVDHTFLAGQLAFPFLTAQGRTARPLWRAR